MKKVAGIIVEWGLEKKLVSLKVQPLVGETLYFELPAHKFKIGNLKNHGSRMIYVQYGSKKRLKKIAIDGLGDRDKVIYSRRLLL